MYEPRLPINPGSCKRLPGPGWLLYQADSFNMGLKVDMRCFSPLGYGV